MGWSDKRLYRYGLVLVVAVALFFRFYQLDEMPGGLFPDEAANGLDINLMEQGHWQPFYERGNGREALFFYLLWGSVGLLGRTPLAHHAVSALIGLAAVLACYWVSYLLLSVMKHEAGKHQLAGVFWRYLADADLRLLALLPAFFLATSSWHITLSRTAFRANLIPLFAALALGSMLAVPLRAKPWQQYLMALLFGASLGLGLYTYIAFRMMGLLLVPLVIWPLFARVAADGMRKTWTYFAPLAMTALVIFVVVVWPLGHYFYTHPWAFVGRSGQVSVFNPALNKGDLLGTFLETSRVTLWGFFGPGDLNWRHNVSGLPFLSPIISPFFALGILLVVWEAVAYMLAPRKKSYLYPSFLLSGWFFAFLIPVITTAEGLPHGLRSIGTIPAAFIISAHGLVRLGVWVWHYGFANKLRQSLFLRRATVVLYAVFVLALPTQALADYFIRGGSSPENFYAFRSDLTAVAEYLKVHGRRQDTYLALDKFSVQTVDYLTTVDARHACDRDPAYRPSNCQDNPQNQPYTQIDPEDIWQPVTARKDDHAIWPQGLSAGMKVVFAQSSLFDIAKFKKSYPTARLVTEQRNRFGQTIMAVYEIR